MFIACLLFVLPSKNPWKMEGQKRPPALMTWHVMQNSFSWSTMFLLGGGYAMAAGVKASGLSDLLGDKMTKMTVLPHWLFVTISILLVAFLTEFSSNVATASIFIPLICGVVSLLINAACESDKLSRCLGRSRACQPAVLRPTDYAGLFVCVHVAGRDATERDRV